MILAIYKRDIGIRLRRGEQSLWISGKRTACKCPKIRVGKKYLILGMLSLKCLILKSENLNEWSANNRFSEFIYSSKGFINYYFALFWLFNNCKVLKRFKSDFYLGRNDTNDISRPGIVFGARTVVLEWNDENVEKIIRFSKKEKKGQCPARRRFWQIFAFTTYHLVGW